VKHIFRSVVALCDFCFATSATSIVIAGPMASNNGSHEQERSGHNSSYNSEIVNVREEQQVGPVTQSDIAQLKELLAEMDHRLKRIESGSRWARARSIVGIVFSSVSTVVSVVSMVASEEAYQMSRATLIAGLRLAGFDVQA